MKNLKHNVNPKTLTRKEIDSLGGQTPPGLDDFDREALEGWQKTQAPIGLMSKLDRKYLGNYTILLTVSASVLVLGLAVFIYLRSENQAIAKQTTGISSAPMEVSDFKLPQEIVRLKPISRKKQVDAKEMIQHFQSKEAEAKPEETKEIPAPESEKSTPVDQLPLRQTTDLPEKPVEVASNSFVAKEIYVEDLKLVDYRAYRSRPAIRTERIIITGTSADLEKKNQSRDDFETEKIEIPYYEFIQKTMSIFARGNYKKSLYRFEEILKTYPDDINANFYGGLCYYNLGKMDKAQSCFRMCSSHQYANFNEEADWYLAKSYLAADQREQANLLLKKIAEANGFYANQALKLLKQ